MLIYEHLFPLFFGCLLSSQQNNYRIKAVICSLMHFSNGFLVVVASLVACFFFMSFFFNYEQIIRPLPLDYGFRQFHILCAKTL